MLENGEYTQQNTHDKQIATASIKSSKRKASSCQMIDNVIGMNKLKAKVNNWQQFSPWEDSFQDICSTIQTTKDRHPDARFSTLSPKKHSLDLSRKKSAKRQLDRTILNMSKINLHGGQHHLPQIGKGHSKRYLGPRETFFAKMNPRVRYSNSQLQIDWELFKQTQMFKKQFFGPLVKNESVKYLDILEEDLIAPRRLERKQQHYSLQKPCDSHLLQRVQEKKNEEQHAHLKRLKFIYNSRRN